MTRSMFWKNSLLTVLGVLLIAAGFFWGFLSQRDHLFPNRALVSISQDTPNSGKSEKVRKNKIPAGRWLPAEGHPQENEGQDRISASRQETIEQLLAVGYLTGHDKAPAVTGILAYKKKLAFEGLNLYTSGHAPEACLMDMEGKNLHFWKREFRDVWPDRKVLPRTTGHQYWRRAYLFENGDLLAIFEGLGLIKLDRNSNVLWSFDGNAHHDLFVRDNGEIYVLTREAKVIPRINPTEPVLEDFITILNAKGKFQRKISILEAFERSWYASVLWPIRKEDLFHTNTLEVLDGRFVNRTPAFRKGNVLISIPHLDLIAVIDPDQEKVVWMLQGCWRFQHQPTFLDNGNLLIFDNAGDRGKSRVIEFDPMTQTVSWWYTSNQQRIFFSHTLGSCQRLPNGNSLITESDRGRAFEVTADKTVVWEFLNRHRAGPEGRLIATLPEVIRIPSSFVSSWLVQ